MRRTDMLYWVLICFVTIVLFLQLHFIESYLREANPEFDSQSEEDQMKMKEELYVEVNRYGRCG